jgi:hypothetical protein
MFNQSRDNDRYDNGFFYRAREFGEPVIKVRNISITLSMMLFAPCSLITTEDVPGLVTPECCYMTLMTQTSGPLVVLESPKNRWLVKKSILLTPFLSSASRVLISPNRL